MPAESVGMPASAVGAFAALPPQYTGNHRVRRYAVVFRFHGVQAALRLSCVLELPSPSLLGFTASCMRYLLPWQFDGSRPLARTFVSGPEKGFVKRHYIW